MVWVGSGLSEYLYKGVRIDLYFSSWVNLFNYFRRIGSTLPDFSKDSPKYILKWKTILFEYQRVSILIYWFFYIKNVSNARHMIVDYFSIIHLKYGFFKYYFGVELGSDWNLSILGRILLIWVSFYKIFQTEWILNFQVRFEYNSNRAEKKKRKHLMQHVCHMTRINFHYFGFGLILTLAGRILIDSIIQKNVENIFQLINLYTIRRP